MIMKLLLNVKLDFPSLNDAFRPQAMFQRLRLKIFPSIFSQTYAIYDEEDIVLSSMNIE